MGAVTRAFSFTGRATRLEWWLVNIALLIATSLVVLLPVALSDEIAATRWEALGVEVFDWVLFLLLVPIHVRRAKDRDYRAPFAVPIVLLLLGQLSLIDQTMPGQALGLVSGSPIVILSNIVSGVASIVVLIEFGIRRGTVGPNRYGPDPLDPAGGADEEVGVFD